MSVVYTFCFLSYITYAQIHILVLYVHVHITNVHIQHTHAVHVQVYVHYVHAYVCTYTCTCSICTCTCTCTCTCSICTRTCTCMHMYVVGRVPSCMRVHTASHSHCRPLAAQGQQVALSSGGSAGASGCTHRRRGCLRGHRPYHKPGQKAINVINTCTCTCM